MLDPDELYLTSEKYKDLLDELGTEIEAEDIAEREGNYIDACDHGFKVWTCLLEMTKQTPKKYIKSPPPPAHQAMPWSILNLEFFQY